MMNRKTPCRPNRVKDGDTLEVFATEAEHHIEVRLVGIDSPESDQAWGTRSAEYLRKLAYEAQNLNLFVLKIDPYGRAIAELWDGDCFINAELVRQGLAWYSPRSAISTANAAWIKEAEDEAKKKRLGVWSESHPIPPWKFRP
jgi:endonuclease YncB( thermonuclease family)